MSCREKLRVTQSRKKIYKNNYKKYKSWSLGKSQSITLRNGFQDALRITWKEPKLLIVMRTMNCALED